jgi:hypothetical protein
MLNWMKPLKRDYQNNCSSLSEVQVDGYMHRILNVPGTKL